MNKVAVKEHIVIQAGQLSFSQIGLLFKSNNVIMSISPDAKKAIDKSVALISKIISDKKVVYGVNTGFGKLSNKDIAKNDLCKLQHNLVISHCTGVGELLDDYTVRVIVAIKVNSLALGHSGVRFEVLERLLLLINNGFIPCVPSQGSVGASGDLAPLAHLVAPLIGEGYVRKSGKIIQSKAALAELQLDPISLSPLEGLSLLNGTQVSTAFALKAYIETEQLFWAAVSSGAMTTDALRGSTAPFREEIHQLRQQSGQIHVAKILMDLLSGSEIRESHRDCKRVQDPYSLRCQPQVMGACYDQLKHVESILKNEINAVTNNPVVLTKTDEIISGGNFHAEPIAFCSDILAIVLCEIGSICERRISLLIDENFSQLPSFLIKDSGLNSGFMIAHVTASALVSENKSLAHPCSIDSIPTSANQEDHVSMATHAARRLFRMGENLANILAVEFLASAQAFDFLKPLASSPILDALYKKIRGFSLHYSSDRYMADDIKLASEFAKKAEFYKNPITKKSLGYLNNISEQFKDIRDIQEELKSNSIVDITKIFNQEFINELIKDTLTVYESELQRKDFLMHCTSNTPRNMYSVSESAVNKVSSFIPNFYKDKNISSLLSIIAQEEVMELPWKGERYVINGLSKASDTHGWHWDDYSYALVFIAENTGNKQGGLVECIKNTEWDRSSPNIDKIIENQNPTAYQFSSGSFYLMKSDTTLHRVTPIDGVGRRVAIAMSWCTQADLKKDIDHETVLALYGS